VLAAAAGIGPPATLVVGEVASLADTLAGGWPAGARQPRIDSPGQAVGVPRSLPGA
jgi:hypothetical protein